MMTTLKIIPDLNIKEVKQVILEAGIALEFNKDYKHILELAYTSSIEYKSTYSTLLNLSKDKFSDICGLLLKT